MKKRLMALVLASALMVVGVKVFATGGSSGDPLISVSYLTNVFLPELETLLSGWAEEQTESLYQDTVNKLDETARAHLTGMEAEGWSYSDTYQVMAVKRGDVIALSTGSGLLWLEGQASTASALVDVGTGTELAAGGALTANHRYLNGTEEGATVTVLSDAASIAVEGYWILSESDEDVTGFIDLTASKDWFYNAVRFAIDHGLFNGVSDKEFSAGSSMNRAMLATVLYRMADQPEMDYSGVFTDVADGQWYAPGVEWAASVGVVTGYEDDTFRPAAAITREQIAVMLYRYAGQYLGLDVSQRGDLSGFPDGVDVSSWAQEAFSWTVGVGIIGGSNDGLLNPGNTATRAEVATMLQRLFNWAELE